MCAFVLLLAIVTFWRSLYYWNLDGFLLLLLHFLVSVLRFWRMERSGVSICVVVSVDFSLSPVKPLSYFFNKEAWEEISFDKFPYFTTRYCNILTLFILLEFRWVSSCTSSTRRHEKQYPLTSFLWQVCLDKFPFTRVYQQVVHPPHALHNGWSACNLFVSHVFNFVYWRDWT